jgi:predicted amino acid dehydrogenase
MKEKVRVLEERVSNLESANRYYTDDSWSFYSEIKTAPLADVVRRIANHLGMSIRYKHPEPQGFTTEFKNKEENK